MALLEANGRRAAFLRRAVERLGLEDRVTVLEERAEVCGRERDSGPASTGRWPDPSGGRPWWPSAPLPS